MEEAMAQHAKLFKSDGSQAARLPQGDRVILEPVKGAWSRTFLDLTGSAPDFPYPEEPGPAEAGPKLDS
jgi:virulence-associated protein VagC